MKIIDIFSPGEKQDILFWAMIVEIPAIAVTNSVLIPQIVFYIGEFTFYQTYTKKDISKTFKYFVYIFINAIILPIAQFTQILDLVNMLYKQRYEDI